VSPSWAETFSATLYPHEVRLAKRSLWRGAARSSQRTPVEPEAGARGGSEPWWPALAALDATLQRAGASRGALRVVVSDQFVRYALVPWSADLVADRERLAFAQLTMREIYGPGADDWVLCLDQQPAGQASFAAAIDAGLLVALGDLASKHRLRLRAVAPAFSVRVQRHRRALKQASFCLVSLEPGRMTLGFRGAQGWEAVRGRRTAGAVGDELASALRQEVAASGTTANGTLYLAGEQLADVPPFSLPGWKIVRLDEPGGAPREARAARAALGHG
jgi:hypothetical protein